MSAIVHCHAVRITEPGQGDRPVIVEWKVPDPEPRVPNKYGSRIVATISPNMEPPVYMHDMAPEFAHDYRIVADGYTTSVDLAWTFSDVVVTSDEGYFTISDDYGVEFWLRAQPDHDCGPGRPFDLSRWKVYRFPLCSMRSMTMGRSNTEEWEAVAVPKDGTIYTMSTVLSAVKTKENS